MYNTLLNTLKQYQEKLTTTTKVEHLLTIIEDMGFLNCKISNYYVRNSLTFEEHKKLTDIIIDIKTHSRIKIIKMTKGETNENYNRK